MWQSKKFDFSSCGRYFLQEDIETTLSRFSVKRLESVNLLNKYTAALFFFCQFCVFLSEEFYCRVPQRDLSKNVCQFSGTKTLSKSGI